MTKVHLEYSQQIEQLILRGMEISNSFDATLALKEFGYYNMSGYFYPLRAYGPSTTKGQITRLSEFVSGTRIEQIVDLANFDRELRKTLFAGLATFERSLKSHVAYILGRKSPLAHENINFLHPKTSPEDFLEFQMLYLRDLKISKSEDFVKHHFDNYGGQLPIWAAVEVMQFGTISRLIDILPDPDLADISKEFGFVSRTLFKSLIGNFRFLRNNCAHHSRTWNLSFRSNFTTSSDHLLKEELLHIQHSPREKIYSRIALLAYSLDHVSVGNNFKREVLKLISDFPSMPVCTPEADMGFPENLETLQLWAVGNT